jgi:hypothetical protein
MPVRLRHGDHFPLRQIAMRQGIGHTTLVRNLVAAFIDAQKVNPDPVLPAQVPALPNGRNTKFQAGLQRRDEKRATLKDEQRSRTGLLRDRPL